MKAILLATLLLAATALVASPADARAACTNLVQSCPDMICIYGADGPRCTHVDTFCRGNCIDFLLDLLKPFLP